MSLDILKQLWLHFVINFIIFDSFGVPFWNHFGAILVSIWSIFLLILEPLVGPRKSTQNEAILGGPKMAFRLRHSSKITQNP